MDETTGRRWSGRVFYEGVTTNDGRQVNHITHRELPLPVTWRPEKSLPVGHDDVRMVGIIDTFGRVGNEIFLAGVIMDRAAVEDCEKNQRYLEIDVDDMGDVTVGIAGDGEYTISGSVAERARLCAVHIGSRPVFLGLEIRLEKEVSGGKL